MGCGVSKDDISEPRPKQSHGQTKSHLMGKQALKPIQVASASNSICICSSYVPAINNPPSPPSDIISTPDSLSSDESDLDPSFVFPSKLNIEEVDNGVFGTTALAALSGEDSKTGKENVEDRVAAITVDEQLNAVRSEGCSTCAVGMLSGAAFLQALMATGPMITQQNFGGDISARVGRVTVISGPQPMTVEPPLRKAEIIDLDEEPDARVLMETNSPEKLQEEFDDEAWVEDSKASIIGQRKPNGVCTNKLSSGLESRKSKLPPLTIVPPIMVDINPTGILIDPFAKPVFPIIVNKQDLLDGKGPNVFESEQFEDLSSRTPTMSIESAETLAIGDIDSNSKSPVTSDQQETTATKSPQHREWPGSPQRDLPDPDIENIVLLESQELDSLPLIPMLDCHGIHKDNVDIISPMRLIS